MKRSRLFGLLSIAIPIGAILIFTQFLFTGSAYEWFGKRGYAWANTMFYVLLASVALSFVVALVLGGLAFGAARREGGRGWGWIITGLLGAAAAVGFFALIVWALLSLLAAFT